MGHTTGGLDVGMMARFVTKDEIGKLQRFLERSYGHGRGFFLRYHPELQEIAPTSSLVIDANGSIAAHVGVYPLKLKVGSSTLTCGGIGGVAAAIDHRGQGLMSHLMHEAIRHMREQGWSMSVLWGDRQRYQHFGYQTCGIKFNLRINRRSLQRARIEPSTTVEEVDKTSSDVLRKLEELSAEIDFGVEREQLELLLSRPSARVFIGDEGYLISMRERSGDLEVTEVISPSGSEAELIYGALVWSFGDEANVELAGAQTERAARLSRVCNYWRASPQGMFHIISWPQLLEELAPFLGVQVAGVPAFRMSIGCRWQETVDQATIDWDGARLSVSSGRHASEYVELENPHLTGLLLGGPFSGAEKLGMFGRLLPVPIHIPIMDHV
jgi:predicted N-acetyltransferase YhbS